MRGFTLVELMIAILIGFLITLALVAVFTNVSRTNREMAKTNNQIDGARTALHILKEDIVHAGYWGGFQPDYDDLTLSTAPGDVPTAIPDPCLPYTTADWDTAYQRNILGIVVQAGEAIPGTCNTIISSLTRQPNTDVLVIRHAETCVAGVGTCEAQTTDNLYFQVSGCPTEIAAGTRYILAKPPLTLLQRDCVTLAPVRKLVTSVYYVRNYARNPGDGIPTLMRSRFDLQGTVPAFLGAEPLVEGIEGFTVELGIDSLSETSEAINYLQPISWQDSANLRAPRNRGDGSADGAFVHCTTAVPCTLAQLTEVVAVRVHILARAETPSVDHTDTKAYTLGATTFPAFNDKFKRHVFSTTVRLNNVSGRRETP